jgi:hypothetical protein
MGQVPGNILAGGNAGRNEQQKKKDQWPRIPNLVPGQFVGRARKLLGTEKSRAAAESRRYYEWHLEGYDLFVTAESSGKILRVTTTFSGRVLEAPDGVLLGRDTLEQVLQKMGDRVVAGTEDILSGEGLWVYHFDVDPKSETGLRVEYGFSLREDDPEEWKILEQEYPPTKKTFMNVPVISVTLKFPGN